MTGRRSGPIGRGIPDESSQDSLVETTPTCPRQPLLNALSIGFWTSRQQAPACPRNNFAFSGMDPAAT